MCIASMAGYVAGLSPEREHALTVAPTDELLTTLGPVDLDDFGSTYGIAKRINQLRVEQAATPWGQRGGRVVSISPGIISTPMGRQELEEGASEQMQGMLVDLAPPPHRHRRGHRVGGRVARRPRGVVRHRLRPPGRRRRDRRHPRLLDRSSARRRAPTDPGGHSHSIVAGGLLEMSSTTRLTSSTSLVMRVEIRSSTSVGRRAQSAVMASSLVIGRSTIGCA